MVELQGANGLVRNLLFVKGEPLASDSAQPMAWSHQGHMVTVRFGSDERYDAPRAADRRLTPMRALRWLLLLPASAAVFYLAIAATIATHYLVEQHLCPAADFDRGICSNRTLGVILELIKHGGAALTVIAVAGVAVIVAPSHKRPVLWAALALVLLLAA